MDRNERDFFKGYSRLEERVRVLERSRAAVTGGGGGVTDHGALTGLGDDDHTQYHNNARGDARYYQKSEVDTVLSGKSDTSHNHDSRYYTETETDSLLGNKISTSQKGVAGGVAELDGSGLVPSAQLPSFVDDVLEYADFASLPGTGTTGKIYVALDTNITYRWSGSAYVEISASLALGTTSSTAHRGDHGNTAYLHSQDVTTNPHSVTKSQVGLSNVPNVDATDRANHTGTQLSSTISDFSEAVEDKIGTKVIAGTGISVTYNDTTGETTVEYTGGGGGGLTASQIVDLVYPIGTIYGNGTYTTNPATLIGYGTWSAYAEGRAIVGQDTGQTEFDTLGETGGSKTHTLTTAEMPSHLHTVDPPSTSTSSAGSTGTVTFHGAGSATVLAGVSGIFATTGSRSPYRTGGSNTGSAGSQDGFSLNTTHTHTIDIAQFNSGSQGGGGAHNNLQPYIVAKWWIRTA